MGFLGGFFESKAAQVSDKGATSRAIAGRGGGLQSITTGRWDIDKAVKDGYEKVIWVYRCVDAIASNASSVPIIVREDDPEDGAVIEDAELHRLLNQRANPYETAAVFRYRLTSQLLLSRKGAFVEIVRGNGGRPVQLHILPSSTEPIPDAKNYVSGYKVRDSNNQETILKPEQVMWMRVKPHPTDAYAQMTPLVAAGLAADTDYLARLFNRNFLATDGRPGMLIGVQGQISEQDAKELKQRFSGGPMAAGQTTVIEADGLSVQDMSATPRDVQWQQAVMGSKEDIMLAFGVPESVLGNASGRTFDNADAEFEIFWQVTMKPHLSAIGAGMDVLTANGLEDNYFVAHDLSKVDVLQRQERRRHDKALNEVLQGVMTIDQYLEIVGREKLDVPGSRVLWVPQGKVPFGKDEKDTQAAAQLMPVGMGAPPVDPAAAAQQGAMQGIQTAQNDIMNQFAARALSLSSKRLREPSDDEEDHTSAESAVIELKAVRHPYESERVRTEARIEGLLAAWSDRQERVVGERLGGTKARRGTRHWDGGESTGETKALNVRQIVDLDRWADDVVETLRPVIETTAAKWATRTAREVQRQGIVAEMLSDGRGFQGRSALERITGGENVVTPVVDKVLDMVRESAVRQSQRIADTIEQMDRDGYSVDAIKREIRKLKDSRSSWHKALAVNITTATVEGVRAGVYDRLGKYARRRWMTMHDERVRPSHARAHGQTRKGDEPFKVAGHDMMYPGDPSAPIEEVAGCRCWTEVQPRKRVMGRVVPFIKSAEMAS